MGREEVINLRGTDPYVSTPGDRVQALVTSDGIRALFGERWLDLNC